MDEESFYDNDEDIEFEVDFNFQDLLSDDEEEDQLYDDDQNGIAYTNVEHDANNEQEETFNIRQNTNIASIVEKHQSYLIRLKETEKRLRPIPPLQLLNSSCKCGQRCDALLSYHEICQMRMNWPLLHHDRIAAQFYVIKTLTINNEFLPFIKGYSVCINFFCSVNIIPITRAQCFVGLINEGVNNPVHPNTGRRFERQTTIEKLARLVMYIDDNFESNPAKNSYFPSSRITKCTAAGEALNIPPNKRRKQNFTKLFRKRKSKNRSLNNDHRSKSIVDNDRMFCGLNLAIIHQKNGVNKTTSIGFFSPGSCYDNSTNAIISQIIYSISTLPAIPATVFIQIDNFPGNKSYIFNAAFAYILLRQTAIRKFYISFLQPGHTHCDVDARFGNFSTYLNVKECDSPQELMSAFLECIPGEAHMKQSVYNFKEVLTPLCKSYGIKSMYDIHIFLNEKNEPMVENARFNVSENLLCGQRQKEDSMISEIFRKTPPLDLHFQLALPEMGGIEKMVPHIQKWEKVISETTKNNLLHLHEEIETHVGIPFSSLLQTIQEKAVHLQTLQRDQVTVPANPIVTEELPSSSTVNQTEHTVDQSEEVIADNTETTPRRSIRLAAASTAQKKIRSILLASSLALSFFEFDNALTNCYSRRYGQFC